VRSRAGAGRCRTAGDGWTAPRVEPAQAVEGGGERLRGEVGGQLRVARAAHEVAEQPIDVAAIEDAKGLRFVADGGEQLLVGALHRPLLSATGAACDRFSR